MKNLKKIAAVVLAATMAVNVAGCAMGGKLSPKTLSSAAKKYGAEEIKDPDEFSDMMEDGEDFEDGAYITAAGKDVKDILKGNDVTDGIYDKSIASATVCVVADPDKGYGVFLMSFSFKSKEDAQDFYDERAEEFEDLEDSSYDYDSDDGEENGITYVVASAETYAFYYTGGAYLSGKTVFVAIGVAEDIDDANDIIDDIAADYDLVLPSEL